MPIVLIVGGTVVLGALCFYFLDPLRNTYTVERTEYKPPAEDTEDPFVDDRLEEKTPSKFDPALVDRRPLREWLVNSSAAVLRLDVPLIKSDQEPELITLHPSYADVLGEKERARGALPSVNMVDGKAKQFDDGLYAALDQAYYRGLKDKLLSHVELVRRLAGAAGKDGPAAAYLAAGLQLASVNVEVTDQPLKERLVREFKESEIISKPIGFYTWNETLMSCFRFMRFFQQEFGEREIDVPRALARLLAADKSLMAEYQKALAFYARLTNPKLCLSLADLTEANPPALDDLARKQKVQHATVAVFPPSRSRETTLFQKLFPRGLPQSTDLMRELIRRIRSGEVNLKPGPESGWYDYQVYALETLLLPEKGEERNKLVLTRAYKKRMLEAFKALITKHRETHVRQFDDVKSAMAQAPPEIISPRLRIEPCASYFLRTARAYAFISNFLESVLGREALQSIHGLTKDGLRQQRLYEELQKLQNRKRPEELDQNLYNELHFMRDLFYGFYLVSAEDIGMKPEFAAGEPVESEHCYALAGNWLQRAHQDADLAVDTRVSVPIYVDPTRGVTRLWATLGVRLSKLEVSYAMFPQIKLAKNGDWIPVDAHQAQPSDYLIPVDEFAEVELRDMRVLTREELRSVCDRKKTREAIVRALQE